MKKTILAVVISSISLGSIATEHNHEHFSEIGKQGGKPATKTTIEKNDAFAKTLNFSDTRAFENNNKGLIASFDKKTGDIIRNSFDFIDPSVANADNAPDSVNPSLWRQAVLNQAAEGLYEVIPGKIYQVRGTDLASISFIRSDSGWVAYDVLLTRESASQSLKFFQENVPEGGDLPVVAMIYSHSHADHFGGSAAIKEAFPDVKVYGSKHITKEIVDENVLAGNAMSRRTAYQYGATLNRHEHGIVDAALAKGLSKGAITYVLPDYELNHNEEIETLVIDGLKMQFMDASGTEAASEMITYIPSMKALWSAELTYQGMHNLYTLRGAKVRDGLKWSKKINEMLVTWGEDTDVLFASHSAPVWGTDEISDFLKMQRDAYGFTHNQTLRLANNGVVLQDMGDEIYTVMPESIQKTWHTNGYHGTYSHNARAVYNMYLGYFDMNPANLNPLPVKPESAKFVEYMGGSELILEKAEADFEKGEYRFVATVLNKVIQVEPKNKDARELLADTYEQLGYQSEGAGWRNIYLTGAQELRVGTLPGAPKTASPDVLANMTVENLLDYLAVQVDSVKAQHTPFTLNVILPDNKETYFVEMSNGNLNNILVDKAMKADATLFINHVDISQILLGKTTLVELIENGKAGIKGDKSVLQKLTSSLTHADESFEIVPRPEKGEEVDAELYENTHKH
ncbi:MULTISPECIES: alkyl/aryl-sulfatase [Aliivibrio]|uniref:MBL fold metallo-hydrolase n=1 Tax=Aliivibrio finisterrensis TaxID=511998 RepID=A0A4Q5KYM6_9GAMM|nr:MULTISPECIES: alkyl sulfatase dimerization domain-containing protein [Aliivibrio]MDD9178110.1 alkyl sulfatase dimerization domain-containing protein [Aliivibrio sp. A6]RYU53605.1 MBL fold metallo-hydrolase [Aliivibrio finisterrensis]RYU54269.1 MBL fold metallo-hydrolase [Aliivibrio finisterrensis]RYU59249.1 MBL fold metallo-hydrolase [Aliivibrio finisterrensis]RYU66050.1 MBL fold metallo-hydrolase [Aliivibrio finisterrensis]